jgi:hypothetical protein
MQLDAFYQLNDEMSQDIVNFVNGEGLSEKLFDALFSYYTSTNEMPYGVAKARTGDPYEWIDDKFTSFVEKLITSNDVVLVNSDGYLITGIQSN